MKLRDFKSKNNEVHSPKVSLLHAFSDITAQRKEKVTIERLKEHTQEIERDMIAKQNKIKSLDNDIQVLESKLISMVFTKMQKQPISTLGTKTNPFFFN